ncbi:MAG: efflux RND transporter periplasmic adaptor subunit [Proteobacteria bacterium]|nr:efflux RND transporter periplasmic adaptor subunit [Pseudomonadota bacterium]
MTSDNDRKKIRTSSVWMVGITALITLVVAGTAAYFLGYLRPASRATRVNQTSSQSAKGKGKPNHWRSSMDPTEVYNHPGKDRMGMALVPVYEGDESAGPPGTIKIDPVTIQNIGVKTVIVKRKQLSREIRTVGRVAYNEERMREITLKVGGWVERQNVNYVGQEVKRGEPLLEIYSPDLVSTQEEYLLALRYKDRLKESPSSEIVKGSDTLLKSAETRLRYWDITDAQIKALRERGKITRSMVLHAPFRGIITERNILEGGHVQPGQPLYHIADISKVWVYAEIYEYEAPWIKLGQTAEMTLAYEPGAVYRGKVDYLYPYVKDTTRTLQVRMEFRNSKDFKLKPNMWANVTLKSAISRNGLSVPVQSVIRTGKKDIALIALEGGRFEPRELRLGPQAGDEFEVLDGLKEGERVVTSAQFLINSESNLQSALSKMLGPKKEVGSPASPVQQSAMPPGMKMPEPASAKPAPPMPPGMKMPATPTVKPSPPLPPPGKE